MYYRTYSRLFRIMADSAGPLAFNHTNIPDCYIVCALAALSLLQSLRDIRPMSLNDLSTKTLWNELFPNFVHTTAPHMRFDGMYLNHVIETANNQGGGKSIIQERDGLVYNIACSFGHVSVARRLVEHPTI